MAHSKRREVSSDSSADCLPASSSSSSTHLTAAINPERICILCFKELTANGDRNLVEGKGTFSAIAEINLLPFIVNRVVVSRYICKKCLGNLKKRNACRAKLVALDEELEQDYRKVCFKNQIPVKSKSSSVIIKKTYVGSVDISWLYLRLLQVFHGCIYENENDSDSIQKVLKKLHTLVPVYEEDGEKKFGEQGIVGDQLSVERGVNCLLQVSNGFSSEDRFDGIHFEIGDFHAAMKFLQVALELKVESRRPLWSDFSKI